jgi:hypothetical protein
VALTLVGAETQPRARGTVYEGLQSAEVPELRAAVLDRSLVFRGQTKELPPARQNP